MILTRVMRRISVHSVWQHLRSQTLGQIGYYMLVQRDDTQRSLSGYSDQKRALYWLHRVSGCHQHVYLHRSLPFERRFVSHGESRHEQVAEHLPPLHILFEFPVSTTRGQETHNSAEEVTFTAPIVFSFSPSVFSDETVQQQTYMAHSKCMQANGSWQQLFLTGMRELY
jgi:hypothetical protein